MGDPLPAPPNRFINVAKIVIDNLVEGLGADLAVTAAVTAEPWLATPIVNYFFTWVVGIFAQAIDADITKIAIKAIIRIQSLELKTEFNDAVQPIIDGSPTDAEIQAARDAADHLIERNR